MHAHRVSNMNVGHVLWGDQDVLLAVRRVRRLDLRGSRVRQGEAEG